MTTKEFWLDQDPNDLTNWSIQQLIIHSNPTQLRTMLRSIQVLEKVFYTQSARKLTVAEIKSAVGNAIEALVDGLENKNQ